MASLEIVSNSFVTQVFLNRPDVKNAMNAEVIRELRECFSSIDESTRVLVLRGKGDFFCAGGDLNWMKSSVDKSSQENTSDALELARMLQSIDECPVPVISVVQGGAFGGGVGLVAASDIVIAKESALFSLSEVRLGLIPATIGPLVMRKIGYSQARHLYLTAKRFNAHQAKEFGLVHDVCTTESLDSLLEQNLKEISKGGPKAVRQAKSLIRSLSQNDLWEPRVAEETSKLLSQIRIGDEAQEGMKAFFEKRKPDWAEELKIS